MNKEFYIEKEKELGIEIKKGSKSWDLNNPSYG